ncbi:uncharacterized protein LOC131619921 [Vicia villosa]|uniref:uncharacterized protein LOC131619921 n=1 Tax=Vicia villosa TaxID=3911 RepID=UPI00273A9474|nr:uncharacterized protein LOC131619921 [Vicia villosa]
MLSEVSDYTSCQSAVKSFGSVIVHDVMDIDDDDDDDDSDDLVIIDEVSKSKKEKTIETIHQAVEQLDNVDIPCGIEAPVTLLPESDLDSKKKNTSESNSLHDTQSDATNSHVTTSSQTSRSLESNYSRIYGLASNPYKPPASTNFESATKAASICNSYSMNQVHMDNIDIPGRTEVRFTLFSESGIGLKSTFESSTRYNTQSEATNSNPSKPPTSNNFVNATKVASACNSSSVNRTQLNDTQSQASNSSSTTSSRSSQSLERDNLKNQGSTVGASNLQNKIDNTYQSTRIHLFPPSPLFYQATPNKRKSTAPNSSTSANFESGKKARLDHVDIPCVVEAPFTSFSESNLGSRQSTFASCTRYDTQSKATKSHSTTSYQASRSLEHDNSNNQGFTTGGSNLQSNSTTFLSSRPLYYQARPNPPTSANFESAKKARLDNVNIPRVVEEPVTLLPESILSSRQSTFESSTQYGTQSKTTSSHLTTSSQPSRSLERNNSKNQGSTMGGSSLQNKIDITYYSTRINLSSPPPLVHQAIPNKRKFIAQNPSTSSNFESAKKARLDNVNISREIEAPFTSFPESNLSSRKSTIESSTRHGTKSKAANSYLMASSQPSRLSEPAHSKTPGSTMGSPTLQIEMDNDDHSFGIGLSASQLYSRAALSKEKSAAPQRAQSSNSKTFSNPFHAPTQSVRFGSKNHGLFRNPEAMEPPTSTNFQRAKKSPNICTLSSMNQEPFTMFSSYMELPSPPLFPQTVSCKKKTTSGKKATCNSSKESHATSSSKPSRSLGSGLSSPLLLTQAVPSKKTSEAASSKKKSEAATSKKKSDPPKKLLQGTGLSSPLLLTQGATGKKKSEASSSKKKSQAATSKKKPDPPKKLLQATGLSCPLLLTQGATSKKSEASSSKKKSQAASSKKKSASPKKLQASKSSTAPNSKSCKQIAGITGSSQLSRSLVLCNSSAIESSSLVLGNSSAIESSSLVLGNSSATESSSVDAPNCLLLEYKWQVL